MEVLLFTTKNCVGSTAIKKELENNPLSEEIKLTEINASAKAKKKLVKTYGIKSVPAFVVLEDEKVLFNSKSAVNVNAFRVYFTK